MTDPAEEEPVTCPCGRELRDPVSVSRGMGPVCWRKFNARRRRLNVRAFPPPRHPAAIPDQLALELWDATEKNGQTVILGIPVHDIPTGELL